MMALGARLARVVHRVFGVRGRILTERYHLRRLTSPREVRNAIAYVLLNARKHFSELGYRPEMLPIAPDTASSGRWFDGWIGGNGQAWGYGLLASVAAPQGWLLRVGWRRHGLIDLAEIPGARSVGRARRPLAS
jgi:hypothetical protein